MSQLPPAQFTGRSGLQPWTVREPYKVWKSKFAPAYKTAPNFHGITLSRAARWTTTAGYFGAATGLFVFFMFAEIPRVSKDIAEKIPVVGPWFHKETPAEDNPF